MLVRDADFAADLGCLRHIRETVFIHEQQVPRELEFDERDPLCRHVLAFDGDAADLAVQLKIEPARAHGRVAVVASHRRRGVGAAIMERLHAIALECGQPRVWCNARQGRG